MATISARDRKRVRDLHARIGSDNEGERNNAWRKLDALLQRLGKTWNDLAGLLQDETSASTPPPSDPRDADPYDPFASATVTPADTVRAILEDYVVLDEHEYVAVALWVIHTHIYDTFMVTPPAPECGKTTLLDVIGRMAARTKKSDSATAAVIYHHADRLHSTLLLDEADNLDIAAKAALRAVLNSGHRRGGSIDRMVGGRPRSFAPFTPVALGSLELLTLPLMSRSIVIRMRRHNVKSLKRFDVKNTEDLDIVYRHILHVVRKVHLNPDPEMPEQLRGRQADNWRPLIAIADACGPVWGTMAREAAVALTFRNRDEAPGVVLLHHIRQIFDVRAVARVASEALVGDLLELDEMWGAYRGPNGTDTPRKLTQSTLALLLRPFGIRPRKFWPPHRTAATKSWRGYSRADFAAAWTSYCDSAGTPPQRSNIKALLGT